MVLDSLRWLVEVGLTKTAKACTICGMAVMKASMGLCNMAESQQWSLGGSNLFHRTTGVGLYSAISEWWHGRRQQRNEQMRKY